MTKPEMDGLNPSDVVRARTPVGDYALQWNSFREVMQERRSCSAPALTWLGPEREEWSGSDWVSETELIARGLWAAGVREGHEVIAIARNCPSTLKVAFASWLIGATFMPVDPRESSSRREELLRSCSNPLLVGADEDRIPGIRLVTLHSVVSGAAKVASFAAPAAGLDAVALRMHTSGTSGNPKPIAISMRSLLLDCVAMGKAFEWGADTRTLTVLPISHANGLVISTILPWVIGGSSVLAERFSVRTFWEQVRQEHVTACSLVPTLLEYLLEERSPNLDTGCLREVFSGSGPLREETASEFEEVFGVPVRQLYGLSETSAVVTATPRHSLGGMDASFRGSVGTALPHLEVDVLSATGIPCSENEYGELVVRGEILMSGYIGMPEATKQAFADGWFHTGDRGYWRSDQRGERWFFIDGRLDDVVRRAGQSVRLSEIDAATMSHPAIDRAVAFGFPHRWYGEGIAMAVVPRHEVMTDEIREWCERRLGKDNCANVLLFVNELPVTAVGKVRRGILADQLRPVLERYWDTNFSMQGVKSLDERYGREDQKEGTS